MALATAMTDPKCLSTTFLRMHGLYNMLDKAVNMLPQAVHRLHNMDTMGKRIRMLREAKGWSVQDLADALGVTRGLIYQWEDDSVKGIRPDNFVRLFQLLKVDPVYLVFGPNQKSPATEGDDIRPARPRQAPKP